MVRSLALAAALVLAGCGEGKGDAPAPQAPTQPFAFKRVSPDGEVAMTIDRRAGAWPALHERLYAEGRRELDDFLRRAGVDRQSVAAEGRAPPAYSREVRWTVTAQTDRLVSLRQDWADFTGGAHGAYGAVPLLWNKAAEAPVLASVLFRPDADYGALDRLLCGAVRAAKAERVGREAANATDWTCPSWKDSRAVLAGSTVKGKAGGLTFLFDPYVLGAYAEGLYEVTVPQARFRTALAGAYADEFGGEPVLEDPPARDRTAG